MITVCRVDHRLLHGQVVFAWIGASGSDCILIANDDVATNELRASALRMAKPGTTKLVMKSIDDSIAALNSGVTDKYKLFVLCETIEDSYKLACNTHAISEINIGGAKNSSERKRISPAVCVSQQDIKCLKDLSDRGISCYLQQVPNDKKVDVLDLID